MAMEGNALQAPIILYYGILFGPSTDDIMVRSSLLFSRLGADEMHPSTPLLPPAPPPPKLDLLPLTVYLSWQGQRHTSPPS